MPLHRSRLTPVIITGRFESGNVHGLKVPEFKTSTLNNTSNIPVKVAAPAQSVPDRVQEVLPAANRFIGCQPMLSENNAAFRLQHSSEFFQCRNIIRDGTEGVGEKNGIYGIAFQWDIFRKGLYELYGHRLIGQHETSRNLSLIKDLTDSDYVRPRLYPSEADYEAVKKYQQSPYLVVAPTSVWQTKEFPAIKWVELILAQDDEWNIYLIGGPGDFTTCDEIIEMCGKDNITNLAGKLSFLESAALIEKAKMNYVNDSAPMHMASSMNAPTTLVIAIQHFLVSTPTHGPWCSQQNMLPS